MSRGKVTETEGGKRGKQECIKERGKVMIQGFDIGGGVKEQGTTGGCGRER